MLLPDMPLKPDITDGISSADEITVMTDIGSSYDSVISTMTDFIK